MLLWLLVIAQFALSAWLVLSTRWWPIPWVALFVATPGIVLAVWAWAEMGLRKIRVHPSPTDATRLITSGPYAVVRHPMYTGLMWFTASLLISSFTWSRVFSWITLLIVILTKMRHEEHAMISRFDQYVEYQRRVPGLVRLPW